MFTGDIYIRGKYATYLKYLSQKTEKNDHKEKVAGVFERMIDVYMTAAIVGVNYRCENALGNHRPCVLGNHA